MSGIRIHNTVAGIRVPRARLTRLAEIVLHAQGVAKSVNLILVADSTMRQLNRRFRRQDKTTDVLSFAMEEDIDSLLGEIYISIPTARRNAAGEGWRLDEELLQLFCHGLLHLTGTHHPNAKARAEMKRLEDQYLLHLEKSGKR
jgi:probable rRNA maturation factor